MDEMQKRVIQLVNKIEASFDPRRSTPPETDEQKFKMMENALKDSGLRLLTYIVDEEE